MNTNRLKDHVYTQGFYLAGNFFTFSGDKVTYDDAVFKFQQQKEVSIDEGPRTKYDVYMVEIPASLTAHAQVMYVNESGEKLRYLVLHLLVALVRLILQQRLRLIGKH